MPILPWARLYAQLHFLWFFFNFFYEGQRGSNVLFISNQIAETILKCLLKLKLKLKLCYSQAYGSELSCVTRNKLSEQNEEKLL